MNNRIRELREAKGITQINLAVKVGTTQQTISKFENGLGVPKFDLVLELANYFNVSIEYLFCLSDKKHKLEHQLQMDKILEEYYDFFADFQKLNEDNKQTLIMIMHRLIEVQERNSNV